MNDYPAGRYRDHLYGGRHRLVGRLCMYRGMFCVPYGSYVLNSPENGYDNDQRFVIVYFGPMGMYSNSAPQSQALSAVTEGELVPVDPGSDSFGEGHHLILSSLVDQDHWHWKLEAVLRESVSLLKHCEGLEGDDGFKKRLQKLDEAVADCDREVREQSRRLRPSLVE